MSGTFLETHYMCAHAQYYVCLCCNFQVSMDHKHVSMGQASCDNDI